MKHRWSILSNMVCNLILIGFILFLQLIHYPLLSKIGSHINKALFSEYFQHLSTQILVLFILPMLVELFSSIILFWKKPHPQSASLYKLSMICLAIIWGVLIVNQLLFQQILSQGYHVVAHNLLTISTWAATITWCIKGILSLIILTQSMRQLSPQKT